MRMDEGKIATDVLGIQSGISGLCSGVCKTGLAACGERVCQDGKPRAFCAKQESESAESVSHSPQGCDACVARVAMEGHPGLARSRDCVAQWIHGGAENTYPIQPSCMRILIVHE